MKILDEIIRMSVSIWHIMPGSWEPGSACKKVKFAREGSKEMPDIALCKNENCPSKDSCYRYTAKPSCHQVYAKFTVLPGQDRCEYHTSTQLELPLTP